MKGNVDLGTRSNSGNANGSWGREKGLKVRVITVGEVFVGKTTLLKRWVQERAGGGYESTISVEQLSKAVQVGGEEVRLELWDTAGQERFRAMLPLYYRGADAALVVYDVTNVASFERAKQCAADLLHYAKPGLVAVLVGNKIDLVDKIVVPTLYGQLFAAANRFLFFEVSAYDGHNVNELFDEVARRCLPDSRSDAPRFSSSTPSRSVVLSQRPAKARPNSCC